MHSHHQAQLALRDLDRLRTPPSTATRWLEIALAPEYDPTAALALVQCDPALAVEVLRAGRRDERGAALGLDLRAAVECTGTSELRELALRLAIDAPAGPTDDTLCALRDHAVATAAAAREIATLTGSADPARAHAAGLLQSLGTLALDTLDPRALAELWASARCVPPSAIAELECELFGVDGDGLALAIVEAWCLPDDLRAVLELAHCTPEQVERRAQAGTDVGLATLVRTAAGLACEAGFAGLGDLALGADTARIAEGLDRPRIAESLRQAVESARSIGTPLAASAADMAELFRRAHAEIARRCESSERRRRAEEAVNGVLQYGLKRLGDGDPLPGVLVHAMESLRFGRLTHVEKDSGDRRLRIVTAVAARGFRKAPEKAWVPFRAERELAAAPEIFHRGDGSNDHLLLLELLGVSSCIVAPLHEIAPQRRSYLCADRGPSGATPEPGEERCLGVIADQASLLLQFEQLVREKERMATQDPLTGAATRRRLMDRLEFLLQQSKRTRQEVSLLILDLDHFKQFNDALGHQTGDRLLQDLVKLLASVVRKSDLVARYGGEEFVVVLPACALDGARTIAEEVRRAVFDYGVANASLYGGLPVSVSIGAAGAMPGESPLAVIARADAALYSAKHGGRNRVEVAA